MASFLLEIGKHPEVLSLAMKVKLSAILGMLTTDHIINIRVYD